MEDIALAVLDLLSLTNALPFELRMRLVDQEVRELKEKNTKALTTSEPGAKVTVLGNEAWS